MMLPCTPKVYRTGTSSPRFCFAKAAAKARLRPTAGRKKSTGLSKDGFPLLDWRGIMALLGTISRTTIEAGGIPVVMDTEPVGHQARIFELLSAEGSCWNRRCFR